MRQFNEQYLAKVLIDQELLVIIVLHLFSSIGWSCLVWRFRLCLYNCTLLVIVKVDTAARNTTFRFHDNSTIEFSISSPRTM